MKIGIFFGGPSREREIAFAGGRTVYDNLNKALFEPVPIFVDSLGHFILLDWEYVYKGTIRDFYPPAALTPASRFQVYVESLGQLSEQDLEALIAKVGKRLQPQDFKKYFDFAFLALHGPYGEDGSLQGLLEWYDIPYSGAGLLPSSIGISKSIQQQWLSKAGFRRTKSAVLRRKDWNKTPYKGDILEKLVANIGLPMLIKAPHQGSSIGISILTEKDNHRFIELIHKAFFIQELSARKWQSLSEDERLQYLQQLTDLREGLGFPLVLHFAHDPEERIVYHPDILAELLNEQLSQAGNKAYLSSLHTEEEVLIERFIIGKEFSCIVIRDEQGKAIALPPTEIIKQKDLFDYRMKYLPGMSRKITPIQVPKAHIQLICQECERLFEAIQGEVYARIDGFVNVLGEVFLNDPNTTSGMLPSSFFFHQAAEIGLNPSQFLTYIIRCSLQERLKNGKNTYFLQKQLDDLDRRIAENNAQQTQKTKVAVIMGGYSSERHISVESGRNIYEKLASSTKYEPVPVFLTGSEQAYSLYEIPIRMMLKDNADDISEKIQAWEQGYRQPEAEEVLQEIAQAAREITQKYVQNAIFEPRKLPLETLAQEVDAVFIALHGRPGEDGALQADLERVGLPYNGSGVASSQTTINKYETNRKLREAGVLVAAHRLVAQEEWEAARERVIAEIEKEFAYPIICKPADDGCSSAVKKIKNRTALEAFATMMFRPSPAFVASAAADLQLKVNEEFPQKKHFLIESLINKGSARHFLEITGGLLTQRQADGSLQYEVFEPSETLALGEVLSLEEKFLAGEGQNITPARFAPKPEENSRISAQVRAELERVARILQVEGYARIDAFVRVYDEQRTETIIIEVNSLPGMTPATCIFHQAAINGYKPYHFIDAILEFALSKKKSLANP